MSGQPGIKRSIRVGETGIHELAAYLLDHGGFGGVPATALVKISHLACHVNEATAISATPYKIASLQNFVSHDFDAGELGPAGFSVASVHRIGIFDLRILNLDRHAGNILVKKKGQHENYAAGAAELVPVDHGLCLPECLDDPYFEWLHWPQALVPFSESETEYILNLYPYKDAELLRIKLPLLASVLRTMEFRGDEEKPSMLETLCTQAKANVFINTSEVEDDTDNNYDKAEVDTGIFLFDNEIEDIFNEVAADLPKLFHRPFSYGNSMSFSVLKNNQESGDVYLGDMSEAEWGMFLKSFEKLVPQAFEDSNKRKLGTCNF
ncbi:Phosphatidylinositol 4-kinase gamma 5 [Hibiscus syriacus]|uniref:1-phosphatidylinositol 4-kinase n=1 Tax=Hibiscus syriacus TaxID=106335 RepID=A0A6A2X795_HIBSY|nr:Phosphatidylinositol 4-kinase gamma 5 [Hibiscus syriacus]